MNRMLLVLGLMMAATAGAQQSGAANPYQGTSNPPPDDQIMTSDPVPEAKPHAGHPANQIPVEEQAAQQPQPDAMNDSDTVRVEQPVQRGVHPALTERMQPVDPDGDIVHPEALAPGQLGEGASIRVRLLDRLSTATSERGQEFHTRVASDVLQGGQVLIPAGAEIDGHVVQVSSGHLGGHGTLRLRPETVTMPNGNRYMLHAEVSGAPASSVRVGGEGTIAPGSRMKKDGLEYGGAVGAGAATGAIVAGPVGAATGGLIGAGVITAHLLIDHPQATLEPNTVLIFTLTETLSLVQPDGSVN